MRFIATDQLFDQLLVSLNKQIEEHFYTVKD